MRARIGVCLVPLMAFTLPAAGAAALTPELGQVHDAARWRVVNADAAASREHGASVVRLTPRPASTPSSIGMALVAGLAFAEGTLEVDLMGSGEAEASFLGLGFGVVDGGHFEAVYFRPFNFRRDGDKDGQPFRAHAVQYVAWPEHIWEKLRRATPGHYEAALQPAPDPSGWFHARVEVTRKQVRVFVDGATRPCLVVERLAAPTRGQVGLWVDSKVGAFRNLTIRPSR